MHRMRVVRIAVSRRGDAAIKVNIIGEVRLSSGSYVEKAQEYGFTFKIKDKVPGSLARIHSIPETAPGQDEYPIQRARQIRDCRRGLCQNKR